VEERALKVVFVGPQCRMERTLMYRGDEICIEAGEGTE
jgi:hypothetical protein